ncbi:MAG: 4Fe-4S ferredoxin, iron-sulfur binding, partial [uncultured Rubrobacteraceae bacterium]
EEGLRGYGCLRGLRRLYKDLPGEGDKARIEGLRVASRRARRPLLGVRRVCGGLPRLGLYRSVAGGGV